MSQLPTFSIVFFILCSFTIYGQNQLGNDIDGEAAFDFSGFSVSMSDQHTLAIGAYGNDGNGASAGHVKIYHWNGSAWTQKGADIDGEAAGDQSGYSVSMPDSSTIAIGAYYNNGSASDAGHVRVYHWNGNAWVQKGADIDGEAAIDWSGWSVSMADSNTVAIGALTNDGNGANSGHVRIYCWSGTAWIQKGADIDGEAPGDQSGYSVSMPDSNMVAIGAIENDGNGAGSGHVRIFSWNGTAWIQKGADIDGESAGDKSGYRVSMPDTNTVAIGAIENDGNGSGSGHVRVYSWNNSAWVQKGADINGEAVNDFSGCSVSMADNNTVAIGSRFNDGNGADAGHARIYVWNGISWIKTGSDIDGEAAGDYSGWSISMPVSNTLAIGAYRNDGGGTSAGHVRIYHLCEVDTTSGTDTVCGPYTWSVSGQTYTNSGIYTDTLINVGGCDSITILNLTVNQSNTGSQSEIVCDSYTWPANSQTYSTSGTYTAILTNAAGCDSVITLNLTVNQSNAGLQSETVCETYTWPANSQTYSTSGTYTATFTNAIGCDSIVTLNLNILSNTGTQTETACDIYTWPANSQTYSTSGIYTTTLTNAAGCDSVVTLNLSILSNAGAQTETACDSYTWPANSQTYATGGIYTTTLTNAAGCDSVVTLNLTVNQSNTGSQSETVCDTYTWPANSQTYSTSGIYTTTLTNAAGCDSVVTLNLTVNQSNTGAQTETACDSYIWPANSQTYATSGIYTTTLTNAAGCDSVVTLNLTVNESNTGSQSETVCDSYIWSANSQTYATSGIYTATLTNAAGCDSLATLNLTVNYSSAGSQTEVACDSFSWAANNITYTTTGTYVDTLINAAGCDSLATLNLTINNSSSASITETACNSLVSPSGNYTWTSSGTYMDTITNAAGCDSVITIILSINSVTDISTTTSNTIIMANNSGANYQWLDCDDNYAIIEGETTQSFAATLNGVYSVELTENGCVDTSECVEINTIGIIENGFGSKLKVYPNPTNGNFTIDLGKPYSSSQISISDVSGKLIDSKFVTESQMLNLSLKEPAGIYMVSIKTGDKTAIIRLVKK